LTRTGRGLDRALTRRAVQTGHRMMDLLYLALIAALFLLSIWMIRAFDRM